MQSIGSKQHPFARSGDPLESKRDIGVIFSCEMLVQVFHRALKLTACNIIVYMVKKCSFFEQLR